MLYRLLIAIKYNIKGEIILINYNELLEEVKQDWNAYIEKNKTIEGYARIRQLYELVPNEFKDYIRVKDDALFFSYQRLGKVVNIEDVMEEDIPQNIDRICLDRTISVFRKYGDPVRIFFKFGKNEETDRYEYIDYNIVVGY